MNNLANKLMLIAAGILMLAGIPSPNVQFTDDSVTVSMIGAEAHADIRSKHACGDETPTQNQLAHQGSHCSWWQWAIWIASFLALAAGVIASLLAIITAQAAATGGASAVVTAATLLSLTSAQWSLIAGLLGGIALLYGLFALLCDSNAGMCDN